MNTIKQQPKNFIKSLQIIHISLLIAVLSFAAYVAFTLKDSLYLSYEEDKAFLFLAIIIAFVGNITSKFLFKKSIKQISLKTEFTQKAVKYSTAHIFRIAMLEFPALMCIIFTLYSNNMFYFILAGILVLMMLALFPTKGTFEKDIPLSTKEKSMLEKL